MAEIHTLQMRISAGRLKLLDRLAKRWELPRSMVLKIAMNELFEKHGLIKGASTPNLDLEEP